MVRGSVCLFPLGRPLTFLSCLPSAPLLLSLVLEWSTHSGKGVCFHEAGARNVWRIGISHREWWECGSVSECRGHRLVQGGVRKGWHLALPTGGSDSAHRWDSACGDPTSHLLLVDAPGTDFFTLNPVGLVS